jgi:hypothetical protein
MSQRHTLILSSVGARSAVDDVVAYARLKGFVVARLDSTEVTRRWSGDELQNLKLAELYSMMLIEKHPEAIWSDWRQRQEGNFQRLLKRLGIVTAADLARLPFMAFVEPQVRWLDSRDATIKVGLLELMIRQNLEFADLDPAAVFVTEVTTDLLPMRAVNCLRREGVDVRWLELLQFVTEAELNDVRNLGKKVMDSIKAALHSRHLHLKDK